MKNLSLKEMLTESMAKDSLETIKGGVEPGGGNSTGVGLGYGCDSDICSSKVNPMYCNYNSNEICKSCVCTSGVGPSV